VLTQGKGNGAYVRILHEEDIICGMALQKTHLKNQ